MNEYLKASQNFNAIVFLYSHITGMIFVQLFIRFQLFSSENCFPKFGGHSQNISKMIGHFERGCWWFHLFFIDFSYFIFIPPLPGGGGGGVYCFTSVRLSIRLRYFSSHFSHIVGSVFGPIRFLLPVSWLCSFLYTLNIYAHISSQASYRYPILWEAFFDPSDSYFLFADLVGFYTHLTYMHIFRRIFLNKYWWQESDIWSQASYRYAILLEAFLGPIYAHFSLHFSQQILMVEI